MFDEQAARYRNLWSAVITQAIVEAMHPAPKPENVKRNSNGTTVGVQQEARAWFGSDPDYQLVCDFAGIDPDVLQARIALRFGEKDAMAEVMRRLYGNTRRGPQQGPRKTRLQAAAARHRGAR